VIVPTAGTEVIAPTASEKVAVAATQGAPDGLFVVTVIITVLPISPAPGEYVKANTLDWDDVGLTVPEPFSVIVTLVALPPKVLPLTVTGVVPQVLPLVLLKVRLGGFAHPHETGKLAPVVVHPDEFLTVIV
jgi:hypothetical protein